MLTRTLLLTGVRDMQRRPVQMVLMLLGVALGVAVVVAIDLANTSASRGFALSAETIVGRATHQIRGNSGVVAEDIYRRVRTELGLRAAAPVVTGTVLAPDLDAQPLRIMGIDPSAEAPFRNFLGTGGALPADFTGFYTQPYSVVVPIRLAQRYGLEPGGQLLLLANDREVRVNIWAVLDPGTDGLRRALDGMLLMDVSTAQELLGMEGSLSYVDLIATQPELDLLQKRLPASVRLAPATEQTKTIGNLADAFQLNLSALSLLALVVGMFLIYNTVMFSVVQRRAVLGTLRALGVTGQQLFALVMLEAAVISAVGAAAGVGLGWVLGQSAVRLVTQTINDLYYVSTVRDAPLAFFTVAKGVVLGIGASLFAAALPAYEAARVAPVTAMRRSSLEDRVRGQIPLLSVAAVLLIGSGAGVLFAIPSSLLAGFAGMFMLVLGAALLVPGTTLLLMHLAGFTLGRLAGTLGRMAARSVSKSLSRTAVAIAALMVAVSVTLAVSIMTRSFRDTVINWLELTLSADLFITAPVIGATGPASTLSAAVLPIVSAVPGVQSVETIRGTTAFSQFGEVRLAVFDARMQRDRRVYRFEDGTPEQIWDAVQAGSVLVSEPFAYRHALPRKGASVTLRTDRGEQTFPVAAVVYDYASDQGVVFMARAVYDQYWDDRGISSLAVSVAPGYTTDGVAADLRTALAGSALSVVSNRALREQALLVFDRTFAITDALRVLAVLVAFIGVLSALMALQLERTRELATMQAVGLGRAQLNGLALMETGLMGAAAGLFSLPTGYVLSYVLIYVINLRSFGWTIQMQVPALPFGQALLISILAALLAAVYPLWRQHRMPVAAGLRQE